MEMNFFLPTKIITGKDCVTENASLFKNYGKKCIIVTGKTSADKCGAYDDVCRALDGAGISHERYNGIAQNPTFCSCFEAAELARSCGAEFVIGIGGGSPLDAAKAVAVLCANPGMTESGMFSMKWENEPLPIIAVGTTAGTGSEVTPVSVITSTEGLKKSFRSDKTFPVLSFGDAKYTLSLPSDFTRSTALDALCHCVEAYLNRTSNEICRNFAVRGIKILSCMLEKTADGSELTYEDRERLYCASVYGGLAISVSGTCFPHAMGYFLSEDHNIPHGNACAVYLDAFISHNQKADPEKTERFFSETSMTKQKLLSLVTENLPEKDKTLGIKLSEKDISSLLPRFSDNKNFKKCYGKADAALAEKILKELFGE